MTRLYAMYRRVVGGECREAERVGWTFSRVFSGARVGERGTDCH